MEKGKTLKQIAAEIEIDKQKVYRFVKKMCINEAHQKHNVMYYDDVAETLIIEHFLEKGESSEAHQNHINDASSDALFLILKQELEAKNKLIDDLQEALEKEREHSREQVGKIAMLADQAQQLQLAQIHPQLTAGAVEAPREKKRWFDFFR